MIPAKYDIECPRGGTLDTVLTAVDENDADINFETTYDSARLQVRPSWANHPNSKARPLLLSLTTANGGIVFDGTNLTLAATAASTAAYDFNSGSYDLELVITTVPDWTTITKYNLNSYVIPTTPDGFAYQCTTPGTSAVGEPTFPAVLGQTVVDGTVTWTCVALTAVPEIVDKLVYGKFEVSGEITT